MGPYGIAHYASQVLPSQTAIEAEREKQMNEVKVNEGGKLEQGVKRTMTPKLNHVLTAAGIVSDFLFEIGLVSDDVDELEDKINYFLKKREE